MAGQSTSGSRTDGRRETEIATLRSDSVDQTRALGSALGQLLRPGDVVLLQGDLGAGKTALTQGIGGGMGVRGVINSPTFTLLKEYAGRIPLYHFDLYRIESADEFSALGFDDYLWDSGACVIEWPERIERAGEPAPWPPDYLRLHLSRHEQTQRHITVTGHGPRGVALGESFASAAGGA